MARQTSPKDFPKIHDFGKCEFSFEPEKNGAMVEVDSKPGHRERKSLSYFFSYIAQFQPTNN